MMNLIKEFYEDGTVRYNTTDKVPKYTQRLIGFEFIVRDGDRSSSISCTEDGIKSSVSC